MLQVQETYVNESEGYIFGESDWYEPYTNDRGHLFRAMQREYGRCVSKMYRDEIDGQPSVIGWVFSKRMPYEDNPRQTYVREVWVHCRTVSDQED